MWSSAAAEKTGGVERTRKVEKREEVLGTFPHTFVLWVTYPCKGISEAWDVFQEFAPSQPQKRRRHWRPTPVLSSENPVDGGARWAAVHGVAKSQTQLNDFTFNFHFHALEKEMATHSSVLAWSIPGTGEPGGLPSVGSHRVGYD